MTHIRYGFHCNFFLYCAVLYFFSEASLTGEYNSRGRISVLVASFNKMCSAAIQKKVQSVL